MDAVEAAPAGVGVCFDGRSSAAIDALYRLGLVERDIDHVQSLRAGGSFHRATRIRVWLAGGPYPEGGDVWPNGIPWWLA
jgi:hypothetical protein